MSPELAVVGLHDQTWQLRPRASLTALPDELGAPLGTWAWEALRIAAGICRVGVDTDDRTIPNEAGLLGRAVHLEKGCYRGQETVARVHTLGRPPRRLVLLHLDGSVDHLPAHGADVTLDGTRVGVVGSSARHHELGPIALALVKRGTDPSASLLADGVAAAQELVVDPEAGLHVRPVLGSSRDSRAGIMKRFTILTICTANICRSPMMEILFRDRLDPRQFEIASAGVRGWEDAPIDSMVVLELARLGHEATRSPVARARRPPRRAGRSGAHRRPRAPGRSAGHVAPGAAQDLHPA